jgi:hypothetical protein
MSFPLALPSLTSSSLLTLLCGTPARPSLHRQVFPVTLSSALERQSLEAVVAELVLALAVVVLGEEMAGLSLALPPDAEL